MSVKSAEEFIERAQTDKKITKAARKPGMNIVNVGKEFGYTFTRAEFDKAMRERKKSGKDVHDSDDPDTCLCVP
ncbi:MAG TPA: Nif11-like leader peptide family natural product precursor [Thermoanaerobaculia bacterium]|jgi:predicted ribosomally synthesized peptide with nif11-like leader